MSEQELVEQASAERPLLPKQPEVNIGSAGHVDHGKCLRWDETVLVDGMPLTGREILDSVSQRGRLLGQTDGGEVYEYEGNEVVSIDSSFEPRKCHSLLYVQDYRGPIYQVKTQTGRTVSVTPEHPLLVNRDGRIVWVKAKELTVRDYAAFLSQVPLSEGIQFEEPFERLRERYEIVDWRECQRLARATDGFRNFAAVNPREVEELRILAGLSSTAFCREIRVDFKRWKALLREGRPLSNDLRARVADYFTRARLEGLKPGEFLTVQKRGNRRRIRKLKDFDFDDDIAKWFAFVWSEGSSGSGSVDVTQVAERRMLAEFLRITEDKIGQRAARYEGGIHKINSTPFVDYLRFKFGFTPGNKLQSPVLPWVCRLPLGQKATFLRWFFTLDGEFNRLAGQISLKQANRTSLAVISYLLASFGIVARFGNVTRGVKDGRRTYTRLSISGRRNLQLFLQSVGFEAPRKQRALRSYLKRIKKQGKEGGLSVPIELSALRRLMRQTGLLREGFRPNPTLPTMKSSAWYKAYEGLLRTGRISRPKLLQLVESVQGHLDRVEDSMTKLPKNQVHLREHLELVGVSLEEASTQLGMERRRLARILKLGNQLERTAVTDFVRKRAQEMLRETRPALDQLRLLSSSPLEFDRIESIVTEQYDGKVFDLSVPEYANFVAGIGALVSHNTTTIQSITGVWASAHSEELRRGITIKVGYADAAFYKCASTPAPAAYSTSPKCPVCGRETRLLRAVSFVDCPGHESLMTNMLAGAFLMDGALLVIAANEPVPKPQTREHLQALQMLGMKRIVIAQNKVDLVTDSEAKKNYDAIKGFVANTVAADAPIVPISAQQRRNIDALIEALEEVVPTPKRDPRADALMYVVRSFDVNKPGMEIKALSGGVLGGSLVKGEMRVGDEIELKPGMPDERTGKYVPVVTRITSLQTGAGASDRVGPGGLVAVGTQLDPTFTKGDQMVGSVIGKPGSLPPSWEHATLGVDLFETAVGSAELVKVDKVKPGENLRLNLGTASSPAVVTSARGDVIEVDLKKPVAVEKGMRAALSRRIAERWRLIGSGVLK